MWIKFLTQGSLKIIIDLNFLSFGQLWCIMVQ